MVCGRSAELTSVELVLVGSGQSGAPALIHTLDTFIYYYNHPPPQCYREAEGAANHSSPQARAGEPLSTCKGRQTLALSVWGQFR